MIKYGESSLGDSVLEARYSCAHFTFLWAWICVRAFAKQPQAQGKTHELQTKAMIRQNCATKLLHSRNRIDQRHSFMHNKPAYNHASRPIMTSFAIH
mmetsp:Transcript_83163/g.144524  ORF Transcript_83163/g.144524 Transcript_83163/m.144524 type:complete len:97 (+) Transcript_83163:256-546(+)